MTEFEPLASELRKQLGSPPEQWVRAQRVRLRDALRSPPPTRRPKRLWLACGVAAAACAVGVALLAVRPASNEARTDAGVWLRASTLPSPYRLPDGSTIALSSSAEGQLSQTEGRVRFELHRGKASFDVEVRPGREFSVVSGRYEVRVVGTRFSVARGPAGEVDVDVERGLVSVWVSGQPTPVSLATGERLTGDGDQLSVQRDPSASAAPSPPPAASATLTPARGIPAPPPASLGPAATDWQQHYRAARYQLALSAANEYGFERLAAGLPVEALAELADAARLAGDPSATIRALRALERRFPSSKSAAAAAFLLGRAYAAQGERDAAVVAFERYLQKNPRATYANEALGRLMGLYEARGETQKAAATARNYLASAPSGPYRRQAESLAAR